MSRLRRRRLQQRRLMGPQQNLVKDELEAVQGGCRPDAEFEPFP